MTKKIQGQKSLSKPSKKKPVGHKFTTDEARKGGLANRKPRISDLLTEAQKAQLLERAYKIAIAGDTVLLKSLVEQVYGRPVATLEAKVEANVSIELINYGDDTLQLRP